MMVGRDGLGFHGSYFHDRTSECGQRGRSGPDVGGDSLTGLMPVAVRHATGIAVGAGHDPPGPGMPGPYVNSRTFMTDPRMPGA